MCVFVSSQERMAFERRMAFRRRMEQRKKGPNDETGADASRGKALKGPNIIQTLPFLVRNAFHRDPNSFARDPDVPKRTTSITCSRHLRISTTDSWPGLLPGHVVSRNAAGPRQAWRRKSVRMPKEGLYLRPGSPAQPP